MKKVYVYTLRNYKVILLLLGFIIICACTQKKEITQIDELTVYKLDSTFSGYFDYLFKITMDSLKNIANEVNDIYGEKYTLKKQRSFMTNDYYLWGRFSSTTHHSMLKRGRKVFRQEDKRFFWSYYLEFVPDSLQLSFSSVNPDDLECFYFYQRPFRAATSIPFVGWLMYEKVSNTYFYGEAIGGYVKSPEKGLEVELLNDPSFELFVKEKINDYRGKTISFPFTGYISYVAMKNKFTEDILSDRFFRDGFNKTSNEKDLDNTRKWLVVVNNELFKDLELENMRIDTLYFRFTDFGKNRSDGQGEGYKQTILACDKTNENNILIEINYSDFYGESKSKYIYNPLDSDEKVKDE